LDDEQQCDADRPALPPLREKQDRHDSLPSPQAIAC
jgi:hypothetical protein